MKYFWPFKSTARILVASRHEFTHLLLGVAYAWFLRELWGEFNARHLFWSVFGSLLPDVDHLIFLFFYGRRHPYALQVKSLLRSGQISRLFSFLIKEHKHNTNLWSHNLYVTVVLFILALGSSFFDWKMGVILFGAMVFHFVFDIVDDLLFLGSLNANWKRWGRARKHST